MRRDPHNAAGDRGRATDGRGLLVALDRRSVGRCGQGSGETCGAAAQYDDIRLAITRRLWLHAGFGLFQLRISDSCLAALTTLSFPRITTSSRWEMRLMHVGGEGGRRCTGTA